MTDRPCRCERDRDGRLTYRCDACTIARRRMYGEDRVWDDGGPDDTNDPATWPEGQGRFGTRPGHGL